MAKCSFPDGIVIKPDGVNELDPCVYQTIEIHRGVDVEILKCRRCGHIEVLWHRTDETEDEIIEQEDVDEN